MALLAMVLCCLGTGCGEPTKLFALVGYNHTEHGIGSYIVTTSDGAWLEAGYLDTGQGGGGMMGTVSLPRKWKPGITVTITMSTVKNGQDIRVEKVVPVPRYDADANYFVVHFLHDGRYKFLRVATRRSDRFHFQRAVTELSEIFSDSEFGCSDCGYVDTGFI